MNLVIFAGFILLGFAMFLTFCALAIIWDKLNTLDEYQKELETKWDSFLDELKAYYNKKAS